MAGRTRIVNMIPPFGRELVTLEVPDYAPRPEDHVWVATELGDVPTRWRHGYKTMDDFGCDFHVAYMDPSGHYLVGGPIPAAGPYGDGIVPVESLGRDSDG